MRVFLLLAACCAVSSAIQPDAQPIRINDEARTLSRRSLQEIVRLAARDGKGVWLLEGDTSQTLPEKRFIDAYLEPDMSGARIRRGRVVSLRSLVVKGAAVRWRLRSPVGSYAQVSLQPNHWPATLTDMSIERPFLVDGDFADDDLVGLVSFLRGSPKLEALQKTEPNGTIRLLRMPDRVQGSWPITQVRRDGPNVSAVLQDSTRHGQTATVVLTGRVWKLSTVVRWLM